jgi:hypothetical protein
MACIYLVALVNKPHLLRNSIIFGIRWLVPSSQLIWFHMSATKGEQPYRYWFPAAQLNCAIPRAANQHDTRMATPQTRSISYMDQLLYITSLCTLSTVYLWIWYNFRNILPSSLLSKNIKPKIYRTIILPRVLYGCDTWSLTLREEYRLKAFENSVLRKIFGPKRVEVTGEWRRLHIKELYALYSSPNITRAIK